MRPVILEHHRQRIQPLWDLDYTIKPAMHWRGWLGIALMALLAALPLLAAALAPEAPGLKATRPLLVKSQQELDQAYLELAAARHRREAADRRTRTLPGAPNGHPLPH